MVPIDKILFLDIETVPQHENYEELSPTTQLLWGQKTAYTRKDEYTPKEFYHKAGIWAEFGKIICISVGYIRVQNEIRQLRIKSYAGEERKLLKDFSELLKAHFISKQHVLCAHNGKEFDFPYLSRRYLIQKLELPNQLQIFGKKPWEIPHLDTLELWKFGDYKHYTSLKLLTHTLGVPSPKEDIDGSQVYEVYYKNNNLKRIVHYCEADTLAVAQVYLRLMGLPLLKPKELKYISPA